MIVVVEQSQEEFTQFAEQAARQSAVFDPDEFATSFIEWVYANPGQPATEYAIELANRLRNDLTKPTTSP